MSGSADLEDQVASLQREVSELKQDAGRSFASSSSERAACDAENPLTMLSH